MKNTNDTGANERGENRNGTGGAANSVKWKKQLVSGAVYIALAVTVVAVTVSTITATLSGDTQGEKYRDYSSDTLYGADYGLKLPDVKDFTFDTPVSDVKQGVDATVTDGDKDKNPTDKKDNAPEKSDGADKKDNAAEDAAFLGIGKKDEPDTANGEEQPNDSPNGSNGANGSDGKTTAEQNDKSAPRSEEPAEATFELGYDGYIKPCTGYISKEYSVELPVYSATMYDYRTHAGVDIACEAGTPVRAVTNGVIDEVYNDYLFGTTVVVKHADGVSSVYSNLSPDLPAETTVGRNVITGEVLGGIGNSALCESAEVNHLHFEMKKDGESVDPGEYLPKD